MICQHVYIYWCRSAVWNRSYLSLLRIYRYSYRSFSAMLTLLNKTFRIKVQMRSTRFESNFEHLTEKQRNFQHNCSIWDHVDEFECDSIRDDRIIDHLEIWSDFQVCFFEYSNNVLLMSSNRDARVVIRLNNECDMLRKMLQMMLMLWELLKSKKMMIEMLELRVIDKMISIDLKFSTIDSFDVELLRITSCSTARNTQFVSMFISHSSRF